MKKLIKYLPLLLILLLVLSCGKDELTLDCSSHETFADSTSKMIEHISKEGSMQELQGFNMGIMKIAIEYSTSQANIKTLKKFDGWTIGQVIDYGK